MRIPFNRPYITGRELEYMQQSINSGNIIGNGEFTKKCESLMEEKFHAKKVLLTNSCTDALEMASLLIDLKADDEVIVPSFTFVSTVNAFVLRGAKPVFVDIREDTLNLDETKIEENLTSKTKAIFPVHYAGVACEMKIINDIAKRYNLYVVEDAAQGVNAKYNGQYLGAIGDLGTYSFHGTKNYTSGEGGAIVINNHDFIERSEILREKGTNRSKFLRGEIDKYTWVDVGSSFLLSDILAAFLYAQLQFLEEVNAKRKAIFDFYYENLKDMEKAGKLKLPIIPNNCQTNYHFFHILLDSESHRNAIMSKMRSEGIQTTFHYVPLHSSPMGNKFGYKEGDLPITENLSGRLLRLPFFPDLKKEELEFV
ncbi:dTDP-4-amino-4,6-dideoxygalactose transaminase, partial [Candidatus Poribacteria bacterium]|nr:dTDP-4-amino-4,6-dideoxygalactose transaminase [Candidatus Poribacteria bacterium]